MYQAVPAASPRPASASQADTPKSVVFGVILVTYRGAQGAPPNARTREAALELARQIAADAKTDFKAALAKGKSIRYIGAGGTINFNQWHNNTLPFSAVGYTTKGGSRLAGIVTAAEVAKLAQ